MQCLSSDRSEEVILAPLNVFKWRIQLTSSPIKYICLPLFERSCKLEARAIAVCNALCGAVVRVKCAYGHEIMRKHLLGRCMWMASFVADIRVL